VTTQYEGHTGTGLGAVRLAVRPAILSSIRQSNLQWRPTHLDPIFERARDFTPPKQQDRKVVSFAGGGSPSWWRADFAALRYLTD